MRNLALVELAPRPDTTRAAWLQQRRTGIGGSDIAAILGLSPWRTPVDVYLDKIGETPLDTDLGEPAYWGTVLEDVVAAEFQRRTGRRVQRVRSMLRHPGHDWALASIDRALVAGGTKARADHGVLRGATGLLECKTGGAHALRDWQGEDGSDSLPVHYAAQCMWYLAVTGLEVCEVAALIGGQTYLLRRVERDDATIAAMLEQAEAFWRGHVLERRAPEPRTGADAAKLFPQDSGELLDVSGDADTLALVQDLRAAKSRLDAVESECDALTDAIKARIGEASGLALDGKPIVTWKAAKPGTRTDWKAVATALNPPAELIAQHTEATAGSRRFLLK